MKLIDGTNERIFSPTTEHIDIEISGTEQVQVVVNNHVVVVDGAGLVFIFDDTDTAIAHITVPKEN